MSENKEIWMETTHGRKSKCKTEFKAVVNKVLVSTLILTTVLGTTMPAYAANVDSNTIYNGNGITISREYNISVESAISNIKNTIEEINFMKSKGAVSQAILKELASELNSLERAVMANGGRVSDKVKVVIADAEKAITGVKNNTEALAALAVVKANLGIDSITVVNNEAAINNLKGFRDVVKGDPNKAGWAYDAIMKMVDKGLFAGTEKPDANGYGLFSPNSPMTRAQFVTVVTRYLYDADLQAIADEHKDSGVWYSANYEVAVDHGLITEREFAEEDMNVAMTRQEMAMVLVRAADELGQHPKQLISPLRIADYNTIGGYYKDYVQECYSMGMICGTDAKGTFAPMGTLTRAQAATVLYRLVAPETRQAVDFSIPTQSSKATQGVMTIYEGKETSRPAKAGDIFVKADGTKVVLKVGPNGILGEGQGVAPDRNLKGQSAWWTGNRINFSVDKDGNWEDSTGTTLQNNQYYINPYTGEGHWGNEWAVLQKANPKPTTEGSYNKELSPDSFWYWHVMSNSWRRCANDSWAG